MADKVEQVEMPVDVKGILRVDTGKKILSIPFEDLMRFPDCLLARCIEGVESKEVVIQTERDANYVEAILDYIRDKSKSTLKKILDRDWKFISAIAEEAEYFLLNVLVEELKKALVVYGMDEMRIGLITSEQQGSAIYERACRENTGLIFINRSSQGLFSKENMYPNYLRLLDHDNVDVYTFILDEFGRSDLIWFKLPQSNTLRSVNDPADLPAFFYQFNLGIESDFPEYFHMFSRELRAAWLELEQDDEQLREILLFSGPPQFIR